MALLILFSGALVSLAVTVLVTPFVIRCAWNWECLDRPDADRKRHHFATPTMGGVAIVLGIVVGGGYLAALKLAVGIPFDVPSLGLWIGALIILASGMFDDLRGLNPKAKFMLQVLAAYVLLHAGYAVDLTGFSFLGDDPYRLALYSMPLTVIWVVGIVNAVNLLDGLDGLASGVALIALVGLGAIVGVQGDVGALAILLVVMGALSGFLIFNFNPASIFMGDSGSLFLGYVLAVYSLDLTSHADPAVALLIPVVLLGVPIVDTTVAIIRRFVSGKGIFAPDHDHIHHRLRRLASHQGAVVLLYLVAGWFALAAFLMASFPPSWGYGFFGVTLLTSLVGLHMLGYLQARAVVRGLRRRYLVRRRRRAAEAREEEREPAEVFILSVDRTESKEPDRHGHEPAERSTRQLAHAEP